MNEKNQRICSQLVNREVYANVNSMVDYILQSEGRDKPFDYDDIENMYSYEYSGHFFSLSKADENEKEEELEAQQEILDEMDEGIEAKEEYLDNLKDELMDPMEGNMYRKAVRERLEFEIKETERLIKEMKEKRERLAKEIDEVEDLEAEPQEIFEWWLVSDFLCRKLKEKGYPVIECESIWGRTTTGQAISIDWVIEQIAREMEILEGQKYEWEV